MPFTMAGSCSRGLLFHRFEASLTALAVCTGVWRGAETSAIVTDLWHRQWIAASQWVMTVLLTALKAVA